MKEYYRNDIQIKLDIEDHKDILKEHFGNDISVANSNYNTRLIYNQKKPEHIQLTIYYTSSH